MSDEAVTPRTRKAPAEKPAKKPYFEKAKEAIATLDDPEALKARLAELEGSAPAVAAAEPAPEPSRSRSRSEKARRRARGANDLSHKLKLGVNERNLNLENFEYRWINGGLDDQRFHDKTRVNEQGADWTPLTGDGEVASDTTGSVLRRAVGTNQAGQVEYAYLCRKPKDLYEEDHGILQALNDKRMQAIHKGTGTPGQSVDKADTELGFERNLQIGGEAQKAIKI